jgi:hypothetical protein
MMRRMIWIADHETQKLFILGLREIIGIAAIKFLKTVVRQKRYFLTTLIPRIILLRTQKPRRSFLTKAGKVKISRIANAIKVLIIQI